MPDIELPEEQAEIINKFIEQAEKDIEEARVNFRWGKEQLELVKKVANLMGVPYQTSCAPLVGIFNLLSCLIKHYLLKVIHSKPSEYSKALFFL